VTSLATTADPVLDHDRLASLQHIADRVLWLSAAMVHHANHVRPNTSRLKVGGHQASSASMVSIMTSLWFDHLRPQDRVAVKPHASPVLHAIKYLLGELDDSWMTTLREFGGLQSYPSRAKDPDGVDYSTGSVGIGATAPIWGALARRYVDSHFGDAGSGRQYSLIGDAELDEGACWEAILDPMVGELGELVWVVDFNRQSLDRVVPAMGAQRLQGMFAAAGWQVLTVKYGQLLEAIFARPGGGSLRRRIDEMNNAEYQRLLRYSVAELREPLTGGGPNARAIRRALEGVDDETLYDAIRNLGGHDLSALGAAFDVIDDTRPTVVFAYTIKGYGLVSAGHPQNHSALLSNDQFAELARRLGTAPARPWQRFEEGSPEAAICGDASQRLVREPVPAATRLAVPRDLGKPSVGTVTTQAVLGRTLLELRRSAPEVASRIVTVSPDVSSSTNLGGWVNKVGVWSQRDRPDWFADDAETLVHWKETPEGQHFELGIAETNLVGLLGELGATWSRWGQPLLPIGVLYDPFVERALEPWTFGIYAGGQSILVGTPSGVSLASEGGAHQSIKTPSIGIEQPNCLSYEPAFALETEWILLSLLNQLGSDGGKSGYLRLSTRSVDQALADVPTDAVERERRRLDAVAGAYLISKQDHPAITLCAVGAMVPEALAAAARLANQGFPADVVVVTSPGLIFDAVQTRRGLSDGSDAVLDTAFPAGRARPMVTLLDGHPHALAFLAGINSVEATHLGVTRFGQSGDPESVYRYHGVDADAVVCAALDLLID
jgi:pyruvate dehydrogenase E1 component